MKIKAIEHVDDFGLNEHVFWCVVQDIPSKFITQAKSVDKENYLEDCFGICVGCDEDGWYVCQDSPYCELYYVDNNGDKHWMDYLLSDEERQEAIEFCKSDIEEDKKMTYQEKIKNAVQGLYETTKECATSRHYTFGYGWVCSHLGINLSNKNVRDDVWEMSYSDEFCDLIQTLDFDDDKKEVVVMLWASNNKKKYTIDNYEEFCRNALLAPPIEEFEDGSIDEDKWYKEHNIHIITGNHDIELEYHADNVNEIEFALREMYEVENDIIGATTGNTVGSEYRPAELSDIIQFAIQDEFNHFGYKMNSFGEFIQYFINKEWDLEKVMWHYTIIFKDIKHYNDCYKCNFGKLDMNTMNGICPSKIRDIVDGLICKDRELLYGVTEDDKSSDIVFVMDNTLRPGGDLVGWFYGEPNEEYIDELIVDYKNKLFGEEN